MGGGQSTIDILPSYLKTNDMFNYLIIDFDMYNNKNKFCASLITLMDAGQKEEQQYVIGTIVKSQDELNSMCEIITDYYVKKKKIITDAQDILLNTRQIIDAIDKGILCDQFITDRKCPDNTQITIIDGDSTNDLKNSFINYTKKIEVLNDTNRLNKIENIDFDSLEIFRMQLNDIVAAMLKNAQDYYINLLYNNK